MSEENVEMVARQFKHFLAGEFDAVLDAWAEDVRLVVHGELAVVSPTGQEAVGKAAVAQTFADWFRHFGRDYQVEVDEVHDLGDRVLVIATDRSHGRSSGVPVTLQFSYLYTLRHGRICQMELWNDREAALEAAGLSE